MEPHVSVVMPNYNKSDFLSSAIDSVTGQTMPNFELLVVDDASTDRSVELVEAMSLGDPRIVLIKQRVRRGAAHCRNVGMMASKAPYVSFLDSDDVYASDALEIMTTVQRKASSPVVLYSDYWLHDKDGNRLPSWPKACTSSGMIINELMRQGMAVQENLMVPRVFFGEVGLFNDGIHWGEDTDMVLRLSSRFPFKYVDRQLYGYRLHPGNLWNKMSKRQRLALKTPIIEKHYRSNIRSLDMATRQVVGRRLVNDYFKAHMYREAMVSSVSSPGLFAFYLRLVGGRSLFRSLSAYMLPSGRAAAGTKSAFDFRRVS